MARLAAAAVLAVVVSGCGSASPLDCPTSPRTDLSQIDPNDDTLPFQYPMDVVEEHRHDADFRAYGGPSGGKVHAAEDFWRPAGTEVYAIADGQVSFSGIKGGYGWLVIVDHPEMNIYSLYGHLSPSRWRPGTGPVTKGDLIGYLGDEWENGGSREKPLVAHLHLGVRVGQRTDYPGKGEWRWMAGWIKPCPTDLGWLQPSALIASQVFPEGGFDGPAGGFFEKWWTELLIVGIVILSSVWWIVIGIRRQKSTLILIMAVVLSGVAWYFTTRGIILVEPIYCAATACLLVGIAIFTRRRIARSDSG